MFQKKTTQIILDFKKKVNYKKEKENQVNELHDEEFIKKI